MRRHACGGAGDAARAMRRGRLMRRRAGDAARAMWRGAGDAPRGSTAGESLAKLAP